MILWGENLRDGRVMDQTQVSGLHNQWCHLLREEYKKRGIGGCNYECVEFKGLWNTTGDIQEAVELRRIM